MLEGWAIFSIMLIIIVCFSLFYFKKITKDIFSCLLITLIFACFSFNQLGSLTSLKTYYQPKNAHDEIILNLNSTQKFTKIGLIATEGITDNFSTYPKNFNLTISFSNDLNDWFQEIEVTSNSFYQTKYINDNFNWQYIKLDFASTTSILNEIAIFNDDKQLPLTIFQKPLENIYPVENIIDEQQNFSNNASFYDNTYFDEIYHVRNAYEIANGYYMYPHVHPLLATQLIALSIKILGFSCFSFRLMGCLFSCLLLPLIYLFAKKLFNSTFLATFTTTLMATEFMHYTTGRIATLEPFIIFFIVLMYYFFYQYFILDLTLENRHQAYRYLYLTSLAMSLSWSTKWIGLYATLGIIFLYFYKLILEYLHHNRQLIIRIILLSGIFFVIQPIIIYLLVYLIPVINREPAVNLLAYIQEVYNYTIHIYNYHQNVIATHPYQSVWYQWVLDLRPIWYYWQNNGETVKTISCFNNPLINISGIFALFYVFYQAIFKKHQRSIFISCGYLATLIPWIFIDRCLFSYHYYASIPFLILAITEVAKKLIVYNPNYRKRIIYFALINLGLFLMFLPVISGFDTTIEYIKTFLQWLESWNFYV